MWLARRAPRCDAWLADHHEQTARAIASADHLAVLDGPVALLVSAAMSRTFVICKPDAVERGLVGEIVGRFERKGLRIAAAELRLIDKETAGEHYAEHAGKPFFESLIAFITRSPAVLLVLEGPEETWSVVRTMMGATNPANAAPGTIRGDLGLATTENLVHGSDGTESAEREIALWFPHLGA
jgi:nucleoside-diphosphate kinase